jgi:anti-sigma B factor antagonist
VEGRAVSLSVESRAQPAVAVVEASGEVDLATVPKLREEISEHIVARRTNLLVDLRAVTYLDSTGLGVLVGAAKAVNAAGGSLRLVCDNPRLLRLLRITGLDKALAVHPTMESALGDGR